MNTPPAKASGFSGKLCGNPLSPEGDSPQPEALMDMEIKITSEQAQKIIADEIRAKLGSLITAAHEIEVELPSRYSSEACKIIISAPVISAPVSDIPGVS